MASWWRAPICAYAQGAGARGESRIEARRPGDRPTDEHGGRGRVTDAPPEKGDEYRQADGTTEVVFARVEDRVLTVREYSSLETFERAVEPAEFVGVNEAVAEIPGVEQFREPGDDAFPNG